MDDGDLDKNDVQERLNVGVTMECVAMTAWMP
jgi:hypothetical protein